MKETKQPVSEAEPDWAAGAKERLRAYLKAEERSDRTIAKYVDYCLKNFLSWLGRPPETLTKKDMQSYKEHLVTKGNLCKNSIVVEISAINNYTLNILERPDLKMKAPKRVDKERIPLTEEETQRILAVAKSRNPRDYAMVCMMYYGETRANEVTNFWVSDIDLDGARARIRKGKGDNYSMINLSKIAIQALRDYIENLRPRISPAKPDYAPVLFLSVNGEPLHRNDVWRIVKKLAFEAGIEKNVFPHLFRHSAITHMAEKDISPYSIQAQSRHKSLDDVMKYIHMSQKKTTDDYNKAFNDEKAEAFKESEKPSRPGLPEPKEQIDDKVLTDIAALLGKLSENSRHKLSSMLGNYEHRIELHGG
jgi:site-specific recombinase XerD